MKSRYPAALWLSFLLILSGLALRQAYGQHSAPIKKKGLIDALGTGGLSPIELSQIIADRGVDFRLTYDNEEDLRKAGAAQQILEAVRKYYRRPPPSASERASAANLMKSSRALYDAHDPNSALPVVNQALELDPDSAEAYAFRAHLFFVSGDARRAERDASIALQIDPNNAEARRALRPDRVAETGVAPAGAVSSEIPAVRHQGFLGFRERALNGQMIIVGILPSGSAARGGLLVGDVEVSVNGISPQAFLDQYIKPGKLVPGVLVTMQVQRQGQPVTLQLTTVPRPNAGQESLNYYGQLIQQFPGNPEAYIYRAATYAQMQNFSAALEDANTFVRLNPGDANGYEVRSFIRSSLGDQAGSKADQEQAARLNPSGNEAALNNRQVTPVPANPAAANPTAAVPAAAFPQRWTLLQYNQAFTVRHLEDRIFFQGVTMTATADAQKGTDKKGNVIYTGKWRQKNVNGTFAEWRMVLKTVTPERIEGTVYTKIFAGDTVTFVPAN